MSIPLGVAGTTWRSRTPTLRGHIDPPNWRPRSETRIGNGPSTVEGRIREAEYDIQYRDNNPHLQPGMLVIWDRAPWRVVEIRELPQDLWPEPFPGHWERRFGFWLDRKTDSPAPDPTTWRDRPVNVVLEPDGGGKRKHLAVRASFTWDVLPEHYAVCRSCGELPPCSDELTGKVVDRTVVKAERLMSILPGACMGCGETISGRQKVVAFPGANLWRPDLPEGTARFHARGGCSGFVDRYRAQYVQRGDSVGGGQPSLFGGGNP